MQGREGEGWGGDVWNGAVAIFGPYSDGRYQILRTGYGILLRSEVRFRNRQIVDNDC